MASSQSSISFWLELSAALMMGLDYFFGRTLLRRINRTSRDYVLGVQGRVDGEIQLHARHAIEAWPRVLVGTAMSVAFVSLLAAMRLLFATNQPLIALGAALIAIFAFITAALSFTSIFPPLINIAIALPFRLGTMALLASPKGPVAGAGFFALLLSFSAKYTGF